MTITPFRPQQEEGREAPDRLRAADRIYWPFERTAVAAADKNHHDRGPGIRLGGLDDRTELIEIELERCPDPAAGAQFVLVQAAVAKLRVWYERDRKNELKFTNGTSDAIPMPNAKRIMWVEWIDTSHGTQQLLFRAAIVSGTTVPFLGQDSTTFHTFQAFVGIIRGFTQQHRFQGGFTERLPKVASELYQLGYDVRLFVWEHEAQHEKEAKGAIERGKVAGIALLGFSLGGWKVRDLAKELAGHPQVQNGNVDLVYTCYLDPIALAPLLPPFGPAVPVTTRPAGSQYHVTFYQTKDVIHSDATQGGTAADTVNINAECLVSDHSVEDNTRIEAALYSNGTTVIEVPPCDTATKSMDGLPKRMPVR